MSMLELENQARSEGFRLICGIDEAGRGPLAGPVFAAAVILPEGYENDDIIDSKKVRPERRESLYDIIIQNALDYSIASASALEIDTLNILKATLLAMRRALNGLTIKPDLALVDGNQDPGFVVETRTVIKGDSKVQMIAAASILAKVSRDRYMLKLDQKYPMYDFARHKGYGTKQHYSLLREHGVSDVHRLTFLRNL